MTDVIRSGWQRKLAMSLVALAAGCAAPDYHAPAGPTAHLTLIGRGALIDVVDEHDCSPRYKLADLRAKFFSWGLGDLTAEVDVEADRWMDVRGFQNFCWVPVRFKPRAGERYEGRFKVDGNLCYFNLVHLVPNGTGTWRREVEPSASRSNAVCPRW